MSGEFVHWNVLFKEYLKRDWKLLTAWVLGMGLFAGGFVPLFGEIAKGQGLVGMFETMKNPAMISLCGPTPVKAAGDYTIGALYAQTMLMLCGVTAMIVAAMYISARTRREEEIGLSEYICSFQAGRHASVAALILEMLLTHVVLILFTGILMAAFGEESMGPGACFLFAASVSLAGMTGAAIAMLAAQIMPTASGTTGASLGFIGLLFILRAGTDVSSAELSMANPMGWVYRTFPFTENDILPLILCILFCGIVISAATWLEGRRDMGAGYLREKPGKGKVRKSLLSVHGLFIRLNRGIIIGWLITFAVLGALYGSVYGDMEMFLESNELMQAMFVMQGTAIEESFTSVILVVMMCIVAVLPIVIVNKLFAEESSSHMSQVFASKVSRVRLYMTTVVIAVLAGAAGIFASAGSLGAAGISVMTKSSMEIGDVILAGFNYFPAVLFMTALSACCVGWIPRYRKAVYVYLGYSLMLNYFHGILDLPKWFEKTAVFSWITRMPVDEFDPVIFSVLTIVSVVLILVGCAGYQRRNLIEGME